eukprot:3870504-Prymnesium_polylepis.2
MPARMAESGGTRAPPRYMGGEREREREKGCGCGAVGRPRRVSSESDGKRAGWARGVACSEQGEAWAPQGGLQRAG